MDFVYKNKRDAAVSLMIMRRSVKAEYKKPYLLIKKEQDIAVS